MSDRERLAGYVEVWWQAVGDFTALLDGLEDDEWAAATDLPGWDVRAVASHVAHLESAVLGRDETADIGEPSHVTGPMGQFTEIGVVNRRDAAPADIVREIREASAARHESLLADPPTDGSVPAPGAFGLIGWTVERLLRNRPLDVWMHEQDVRRAVGRPGGLDSPGAVHTVDYLSESLGFVLAKRVGAPAGTSVVLEVDGHAPVAYAVSDSGRGTRLETLPDRPAVRLRTDRDSFIRLAGGRGAVPPEAVLVQGDRDLGERVVKSLAVTP